MQYDLLDDVQQQDVVAFITSHKLDLDSWEAIGKCWSKHWSIKSGSGKAKNERSLFQ